MEVHVEARDSSTSPIIFPRFRYVAFYTPPTGQCVDPAQEFYCWEVRWCIPRDLACNGVIDCPQGEDERECATTNSPVPSTGSPGPVATTVTAGKWGGTGNWQKHTSNGVLKPFLRDYTIRILRNVSADEAIALCQTTAHCASVQATGRASTNHYRMASLLNITKTVAQSLKIFFSMPYNGEAVHFFEPFHGARLPVFVDQEKSACVCDSDATLVPSHGTLDLWNASQLAHYRPTQSTIHFPNILTVGGGNVTGFIIRTNGLSKGLYSHGGAYSKLTISDRITNRPVTLSPYSSNHEMNRLVTVAGRDIDIRVTLDRNCRLGLSGGLSYVSYRKVLFGKRCNKEEFLCYKQSLCIPRELRCDGKKDCPRGEDEDYCKSAPTKPDPLRVYGQSQYQWMWGVTVCILTMLVTIKVTCSVYDNRRRRHRRRLQRIATRRRLRPQEGVARENPAFAHSRADLVAIATVDAPPPYDFDPPPKYEDVAKAADNGDDRQRY